MTKRRQTSEEGEAYKSSCFHPVVTYKVVLFNLKQDIRVTFRDDVLVLQVGALVEEDSQLAHDGCCCG